jgi:lysophospholipase L1-like esterase
MESGGDDAAPPTSAMAAVDVSDTSPTTGARPTVICIGDSQTQMGSRMPGGPPSLAVSKSMQGILKDAPKGPGFDCDLHGPGWCQLLARDFQWYRRADVLNRGFNGYTSKWLREDIEGERLGLPPPGAPVVAITIKLGSNDMSPYPAVHVPVKEYMANLEAIVRWLRQRYTTAAVLLMTPPPTDGPAFDAYMKGVPGLGGGRNEKNVLPYVAAVRELAGALDGVTLVDWHAELSREPQWKKMLWDGLHYGTDAQALCYKLVARTLATLGRAPADLPTHRPELMHKIQPAMFDEEGMPRVK